MNLILDALKGILMGIANIIPGVSGGTMAVSLGVYDKLIGAVSNIFHDFRKSLRTLLPLLIGMGVGIIGFTYIIEYLLSNHPFPTCLAFTGLILGGLPYLWSAYTLSMRTRRRPRRSRASLVTPLTAFLFLFFAAAVIAMALASTDSQGLTAFTPDSKTLIILFFIGIIAAATMIIPGVSGSLVLMILGYYYGILNTIKSFMQALLALDMDAVLHNAAILIPFGIGVVLGVFLISKLIEYLFHNHAGPTYSAILGLIVASPAAILINTGALSQITMPGIVIGCAAFLICTVLTYKLGE
ncbi:MAG: DUF368 domain-containing protein [Lachnospiraceae bacterium]|nr:DUF368 domain-containing protein [Lachnospiraceae bacterium]